MLDFDRVVSDVRMPHINGVELVEWVRANRPERLPRMPFMRATAAARA